MFAYAITDPSTLSFKSLSKDIAHFATKADMILYRDKNNPDYDTHAETFILEAKEYDFKKILLHNEIELAVRLGADGVHLSSNNISQITLAKRNGLFVIVSTHTIQEAKMSQSLGADMVTFSPVFESPGKGEAVGVQKLAQIASLISIPVIALGGILTPEQIAWCEEAGAKGFASIRYFKQ